MKKFAKIMAVALVAVMAIAVLAACGYPSDPKKAAEQLEKKGYEVQLREYDEPIEGLVASITAEKADDDKMEMISIAYYEDAASAKDAYEEAKKEVDSMKKMLETMGAENIKVSIKRSGVQVIAEVSYKLDLGGLLG